MTFETQFLDLIQTLPQGEEKATLLKGAASTYRRQGCYIQAIECYKKALESAKEIDSFVAEMCNHLGDVYLEDLGQYEDAFASYIQALYYYDENTEVRADTLRNLAKLSCGLDEYERAISFYERAILVCLDINDWSRWGENKLAIGKVFLKLHLYSQARATFQEIISQPKATQAAQQAARFGLIQTSV